MWIGPCEDFEDGTVALCLLFVAVPSRLPAPFFVQ